MTAPPPAAASTRRTCEYGPILVDYDERVLTPRTWTLAQSTWAADLAGQAPLGPILELCAGAGHIGLAAAVLADRDLVQIEADPVAADYARFNAERAGWAQRTEIRAAPIQTALTAADEFGLIIADPPYLTSDAIGRWPDDPVAAIDGGPDGLGLVRTCLVAAAEHLAADGRMLLQVAGPSQADQVARLLAGAPDWSLLVEDRRVIDGERAIVRVDRR